MKISLKTLIKEQIAQTRLDLLSESIVSDIMALILSPKVKKAVSKLKNDPEYKELERQAKLAQQELEAINKRLERNLSEREKVISDMKRAGIKVDVGMDIDQVYTAYKDWQSHLNKSIKSKSTWEKYLNR
jgi:hypothetical protein